MKLSPDQQQAFSKALEWYKSPSLEPFKLFGLAGTGKSTLANLISKEIQTLSRGKILHAAYTGKAANVMRLKGIQNASTIHSLVYKLIGEEEGQPEFVVNWGSPLKHSSLLILDECSMIDTHMAKDLLGFRKKILVLGDPGQLPPIGGDSYFSSNPHSLLTTIHRQALDNPIIRDSLGVREGLMPEFWNLPDDPRSKRISKGKCTMDSLKSADQILVGTHKRRLHINAAMREEYGFSKSKYPQAGEKLICTKNNHSKGIFNGGIFSVVEKISETVDFIEYKLKDEELKTKVLMLHKIYFENPSQEDLNEYPKWKWFKAEHFDFAYAITTHKAQGSQWENVVVIDDNFGSWSKDKDLKNRWLYTAWTRASESIIVYN